MKRLVPLACAGVLLAGCGSDTGTGVALPPNPVASPTAIPAADGPVQTTYAVTVLDDGDGAELCVGAVAESYPPQCGGPPITNWDWAEHAGDFEQEGDVRWGEFHVVGTFDGERFTTTEVTPGDEYDPPERPDDTDLSTPCPDPGGWSGEDPGRVSPAALDEAGSVAQQLETYGALWVDRSRDLRTAEQVDQDAFAGKEDVSTWILNVAVTDDLAGAEAALREVWGGAVCVSRADYTESRIMGVRKELDDIPELQSMSSFRQVELGVLHDDGSIQAWVDQEYGEGLVRVRSVLVPVGD